MTDFGTTEDHHELPGQTQDWLKDRVPGEPAWVPVVARRGRLADHGQLSTDLVAMELVLAVTRPADSDELWLSISGAEDTTVQLELSLESASRLVRGVQSQLRTAAP